MGIVQGLAEFLPISSSGHLILVPYLLGWHGAFLTSLAFSVMLHIGTLIALLIYFRREWVAIVGAGLASIRDRSIGSDPNRRLAWLIVIATIPAVLVGPLLGDAVENAIRAPGVVAISLLVGAAILWVADRWGAMSLRLERMSFGQSLVIGLAQAIALVPGISRSGISISAGLFLGLTREAAVRFSFLLGTPVLAGAGGFEAIKLLRGEAAGTVEVLPLAVGMVAAAISGLVAIHLLLRFVRTNRLTVFVVERVAMAAITVVVFLAR